MKRRIVFRPAARGDLFGLYDYIAERSGTARAGEYIDRIEAACLRLVDFPEQGHLRDDIELDVRTIGFERRILIVYRTVGAEVQILRVLYAGRELPEGPHDW